MNVYAWDVSEYEFEVAMKTRHWRRLHSQNDVVLVSTVDYCSDVSYF
jgi:hypothetical protein